MRALLIIDIQNDFLPGGSLAVKEGQQIIPVVNRLLARFDYVYASKDWHPANHGSFASSHVDKQVGEQIELNGLQQMLWPVHCVQNTHGAEFHEDLDQTKLEQVVLKGTDINIDSYSAFFDNAHRKATGLDELLEMNKITELYVLGLATDYCVKFSVLDAQELGYQTYVVEDACRGVGLNEGDIPAALEEMRAAGAELIQSSDLL